MTAATNPSIEDLVLGALPGIPMVRLHNPVLAYEVGDDFIGIMRRAAAGELSPFILVVERSSRLMPLACARAGSRSPSRLHTWQRVARSSGWLG